MKGTFLLKDSRAGAKSPSTNVRGPDVRQDYSESRNFKWVTLTATRRAIVLFIKSYGLAPVFVVFDATFHKKFPSTYVLMTINPIQSGLFAVRAPSVTPRI